ncbi:MAG: hypothetical protein MPJ50_13270 [Pirellulales bacterium]|nr:hypothetical protein [Pirellulales bacterium]
MDRILKFLILLSLALVLTTGTIGYVMGDPRQMPPMKTVHFLMGIITSLAVMLVNGIVATYFIGTSRWCKEVCQTYALSDELWQRAARCKRSAFPITLAGMLVFVGVVSFGAMADPGTGLNLDPLFGIFSWATVHLLTAILGVTFFLYAAKLQLAAVRRNHAVIEEIMDAVSEIRVARGLDDDGAASQTRAISPEVKQATVDG